MDIKLLKKFLEELKKRKIKNRRDVELLKKEFALKFKIPYLKNTQLLTAYQNLLKKGKLKKSQILEKILKKKPVRSLSGIVNISVVTKPYFCPGRCIFCPAEKNLPKSYLSGEPAIERAKEFNFDPFLQTTARIKELKTAGHSTAKIELRIVGGTWSVYPKNYQQWFLKRCFEAANGKKSKTLKEAQRINEKAKNRIVGISIETRADLVSVKEIKRLREYGVTLVEIGVQTLDNEVLEKNQIGFKKETVAEATKLLKDAGFKVLYHLMPNLFGSNFQKDFLSLKSVFEDENFRPDWIKIYPLMIIKGTKLYQIWKKGEFLPYSDKKLIELLIKIKEILPYWVRVARIVRDIPAQKIEAGCKISNLREVLREEMKKRGLKCKCIRCREIRERYKLKEKVYLFREDYEASGGKEIFLSFENKSREKLYSLLRLRIPSQIFKKERHFIPILNNSAIIREIQTYGESVPIAEKKLAPQHRGLGKKLIKEAEKIAKKEFKLNKIAIISGVGARDYFRKFGYKLKETYMVKRI